MYRTGLFQGNVQLCFIIFGHFPDDSYRFDSHAEQDEQHFYREPKIFLNSHPSEPVQNKVNRFLNRIGFRAAEVFKHLIMTFRILNKMTERWITRAGGLPERIFR